MATLAVVIGATVIGAAVLPALVTSALTLFGFGVAGPIAGGIDAGVQTATTINGSLVAVNVANQYDSIINNIKNILNPLNSINNIQSAVNIQQNYNNTRILNHNNNHSILSWNNLYNDLLVCIFHYCDIITLTQSIMPINLYWYTTTRSIRLWSNREIIFKFNSLLNINCYQSFITNNPYINSIKSIKWIDVTIRNRYSIYSNNTELVNKIHTNSQYCQLFNSILQYQSAVFNQLVSLTFFQCILSRSMMITITTAFNQLNSLTMDECTIAQSILNLLSNNNNTITENRLISQLTVLKLIKLNWIDTSCNNIIIESHPLGWLVNLIQLEKLAIRDCYFNELWQFNDIMYESIGFNGDFYSLLANKMNQLKYLDSDELVLDSNYISILLSRLTVCSIFNYNKELDWVDILTSAAATATTTATEANNSILLVNPLKSISLDIMDKSTNIFTTITNKYYYTLTKLNIAADINITDLIILSTLPELIQLNIIIYKPIDNIVYSGFKLLPKLRILTIKQNPLFIKSKSIANSELTNEGLLSLSECIELRELSINIRIDPNLILDQLIFYMSRLIQLEYLYISKLALSSLNSALLKKNQSKSILTNSTQSNSVVRLSTLNLIRSELGNILPNTVIVLGKLNNVQFHSLTVY